MAAPRSRTRRAFAKGPPARCISPICAIPTATSCAGFIACRRKVSRGPSLRGRPSRTSPAPLRLLALRQRDQLDAVLASGQGQLAVLERQRIVTEDLAPPAVQ